MRLRAPSSKVQPVRSGYWQAQPEEPYVRGYPVHSDLPSASADTISKSHSRPIDRVEPSSRGDCNSYRNAIVSELCARSNCSLTYSRGSHLRVLQQPGHAFMLQPTSRHGVRFFARGG